MPNTPTTTLCNGVVVKVGDVVPMTDGSVRTICFVDPQIIRLMLNSGGWAGEHYSYNLEGKPRLATLDWPAIDLAALARVQAAAPGEREADPLDGLPIERENMLAERQRLLDRKFAGDMTSGEATRLAFVRYGLDVWEEATRTPSPEAAPGAEAKVRALDEALRKLESKWRREGENMVFSKHRRDAMKGCADALAALIGGDNG